MDHATTQPAAMGDGRLPEHGDDVEAAPTGMAPDRRPATGRIHPERRCVHLPLPSWPWSEVPGGVPFAAPLVAALLVLLARHAGQPRATLALLRQAAGGALATQWLSASLAPDLRFGALEARVAAALAAWPDPAGGLQAADATGASAPGAVALRVAGLSPLAAVVPFDVCFTLDPQRALRVDFDGRLYHDSSFERLGRRLYRLLLQVADAPGLPVSRLSLPGRAERSRLLALSRGERRTYPVDQTMAQLFEAQARRRPAAVAIEGGGEWLSYAQVDALSLRLAGLIDHLTPPASRVVPVLHSRHPRFLVAVMAVMRCGRAFLPVDPGHPPERVRHMLQRVQARTLVAEGAVLAEMTLLLCDGNIGDVVLTDAAPAGAVAGGGARLHDAAAWRDAPPPAALPAGSPRDAAYIIFTSGSTGQPKGVISRHDGAVNHMFAEIEALGLDEQTRFLQAARLTTDLCIWQFLAPVAIGATCVVAADEDVVDPQRLHGRLVEERITIVELVPVLLRALADHLATLALARRALPALRWMMVSGEPLPVALANLWLALYPRIPVVNAYGPTEVSDDSTQCIVREPLPETSLGVPIGRPLPNLQVLILDADGELVPEGVMGELHVAGIGVGDGYWGDPERTAAAFVPNRHAGPPYGTLYRTGDRGRWLEDGQIELAGRLDDQVKIRGQRVELREVESVLARHPAVSHCVAVVREDVPGRQRLVAYVVATAAVTPAELRAHLAPRLPDCMVPTAWVFLDRLPMTANGVKVNRRALPPPGLPQAGGEDTPRTPLQQALAAAWSQVLGHPRIGLDDDFFELGGDSVHAVELAVLARAAGIVLPPGALFEQPTVARLARALEDAARGAPPWPPDAAAASDTAAPARPWTIAAAEREALEARLGPLDDVYPLAPAQRGVLAALLLGARGRGVYVEQVSGVLCEPGFDPDLYREAWAQVGRRHAALRTVIVRQGLARPLQVVCREVAVHFEVQDLRGRPEACDAARLAAQARDRALQRLRLDRPPLMRLVLSRLSDDRCHFTWTYPHILLDGWSEAIVLAEVLQAYRALRAGSSPLPSLAAPALPPPPPARPYVDYVDWMERLDTAASRAYWSRRLEGLPAAAAWPPRRAMAAGPAPHGGFVEAEHVLPAALTQGLAALARRRGWTPGTLLQGAWAIVQAAHSGCQDLVFGVAVSGRQLPMHGIESVVGLAAGLVPLRLQVLPGRAADAWLGDVQRVQFAGRRHEAVPLAAMRDPLAAAVPGLPFSTCFVLANYPSRGLEAGADGVQSEGLQVDGLRVEGLQFHTRPDFPLTLLLRPGAQLSMRCSADTRFLPAGQLQALVQDYAAVLAALCADPAQAVAALLALVRPAGGAVAPQANAWRACAIERASA